MQGSAAASVGGAVFLTGSLYVAEQAVSDAVSGRLGDTEKYVRKALAGSVVGFLTGASGLMMQGASLGKVLSLGFGEGFLGNAAAQGLLNEDGEINWALAIGDGMFSAVMAGLVWRYSGNGERRIEGENEIIKNQEKEIVINTSNTDPAFGELNPVESLNKRQRELLEQLSNPGDTVLVHKKSVSMNDLRQLTNVTGDEFNMFTNGSRRLIIRGSGREIKVTKKMHNDLITGVYGKFSVHTHPPGYSIEPGPRDGAFLLDLGQRRSAIWGTGVDKYGQKRNGGFLFGVDDMETDEIRREAERVIMRKLYENN